MRHGEGPPACVPEPLASIQPVLVILAAALQRPAGLRALRNKRLGWSCSSISPKITANDAGAEGRESRVKLRLWPCTRSARPSHARQSGHCGVLFCPENRCQKPPSAWIQRGCSSSALLPQPHHPPSPWLSPGHAALPVEPFQRDPNYQPAAIHGEGSAALVQSSAFVFPIPCPSQGSLPAVPSSVIAWECAAEHNAPERLL